MRILVVNNEGVAVTQLLSKNGHYCFELNLANNGVAQAIFEPENRNVDNIPHKVVKAKENCIYETAMNKENFIKKIQKPLTKYANNR